MTVGEVYCLFVPPPLNCISYEVNNVNKIVPSTYKLNRITLLDNTIYEI